MQQPDLIDAESRRAIAASGGINARFLYQCLTGRRDMEPAKAVDLERTSGRRVRRWQLRRDWHRIWPELVGTEGAPAVPEECAGSMSD